VKEQDVLEVQTRTEQQQPTEAELQSQLRGLKAEYQTKLATLRELQRTEKEKCREIAEEEAQLEAARETVRRLEQELQTVAAAYDSECTELSRQLVEQVAATEAARDVAFDLQNTVYALKRDELALTEKVQRKEQVLAAESKELASLEAKNEHYEQ
jgi:hypothetical protein